MESEQKKHQVARGALPDAETDDELWLIKQSSELRATYQVRLLTYRAIQEGKRLVIEVPELCKIHGDLQRLAEQYPKNVTIARA